MQHRDLPVPLGTQPGEGNAGVAQARKRAGREVCLATPDDAHSPQDAQEYDDQPAGLVEAVNRIAFAPQ